MNNEDKFNELYKEYEHYVQYLLKNIYDWQSKEDISQEVWLTIWQKMSNIEEGKEKAYIKKIVYYSIGNYITKSNRRKLLMTKLQLLYNTAYLDDTESYLALMDFLECNLHSWEFHLLMMHMQGLTQVEMANELHIPQSKVSVKLRQTMEKVKYLIKNADKLSDKK